MNTKYTIKNFRIFDEDGETLDLKPITILTGCNSSGKSSIVKSLTMLCDYFAALKQDRENVKKIILTQHELDFSKKPNNLLGRLSKVIHRDSSNNTVTFGVRVHSLMLTQDIDIDLTFSIDENSNNGVIDSIVVKKIDGTVIFASTKDVECEGNFCALLPDFKRFIEAEAYITALHGIEINREIGLAKESMSDDEFNTFKVQFEEFIAEFKKKYGPEALLGINKWVNAHNYPQSLLNRYTGNKPEMIDKFEDTDILYYVPVLDKGLAGNKEESLAFLDDSIANNQDNKTLVCVLNKIREAFASSSSVDFMSFYKDMECEYLSNFSHKSSFPSNGEACPQIFNAQSHTIKGQDIAYNRLDAENVHLLDDDESRKTDKLVEFANEKWAKQPLNFPNTFEALAMLSDNYGDCIYYHRPNGREYMEYSSNVEYLFFRFIEAAIEEVVTEDAPDAIDYVSSSIINVKRLYPLESDDEFTGFLKRYLSAKRNMDKRMKYVAGSFLNKWIDRNHFDIGSKISIDIDKEGLGIMLRLHQDENDETGSLLADSGYGVTQLFAILLSIEVAIMERKRWQKIPDNKISVFSKKETCYSTPTIAIEEPEIHLHPNYQAMLAEMFVEAHKLYGIDFIIETHSEYLIRKLQTLVLTSAKENQIDRNLISIIYINNADVNKREFGEPHVKSIEIGPDGFLDGNFGTGFFDQSLIDIRKLQEQEG